MTPITVIETEPDLMAAGEDHTCAIKADGTVRCWGEGAGHRLGYGNNGDRSTPTATASLGTNRTAVDITAGDTHTCVVLDDGTVSCWGTNLYGELGDGTTTTRSTPTQTLALGRPAVAIEAGFDFTCALMDNGSIMCWGRNHYGQLGRGYRIPQVDNQHQCTQCHYLLVGTLLLLILDTTMSAQCWITEV